MYNTNNYILSIQVFNELYLVRYFYDFYKTYTWNKCVVISVCIFKIVKNFTKSCNRDSVRNEVSYSKGNMFMKVYEYIRESLCTYINTFSNNFNVCFKCSSIV